MRFCDFFAGIGGFRLGLERAGHKGVWACEVDPFCRKIYAQHFEEPRGKDINDVKPNEIPEADLWCGGFPCQDLSVAGKRGGLQANRSGLYWVWYELMRKRKPQWLLIENVPGLLSSPPNQPGADFGFLLSSLDEIGYGVAWRVLDAKYFGLAQQRPRVFIIGCLGKPCPPEILFEREGLQRGIKAGKRTGETVAALTAFGVGTCGADDNQAQAGHIIVAGFMAGQGAKARSIGYREEQSPPLKSADSGANRVPAIVGPFPNPNGVRENTGIRRRVHAPDNPRYKALGNAVAVPVVEWIGRRLKAYG